MASRSRELRKRRAKSILCKLQFGREPDFKFELLPLHSPLLGQSLLVSFPPLIDMLKFSGYSYLIRGQPLEREKATRRGGAFSGFHGWKPAGTALSEGENYYARGHSEPATGLRGSDGGQPQNSPQRQAR